MKYDLVGISIYLLLFLMALGETFFTARFIWLLYKIIELLCIIQGEDCRKTLESNYGTLGKNPEIWAKSHPLQILIGRIIGVLSLLFFACFISSILF